MERNIRLSVLLLALILPASVIAEQVYDFEVDGIYYRISENGKEVSVTYKYYSNSSHTAYYESDYTGDVTIPATVKFNDKTFPVTEIGDHAFYQRGSVTSITIPGSVTTIDWDAFSYCTGLTRVAISDLAAWCNMDIRSNPLEYAQHLYLNGAEVTDLTIPDGVTAIKNSTFQHCTGLTSVTIPDGVTSIGNNAFEDCTSLTNVSIGNSVTEIGGVAFDGCISLQNVTLGNALTIIWESAFEGCTSLTSIMIPNSVTDIGSNAFRDCTSLSSVSLGNSLRTINVGAFYGCTALMGIDIPDAVITVGGRAFYGCSGLTNVSIGNTVSSFGQEVFMNCPSIGKVICKAATPPAWYGLNMFTANVCNHAPLHVPAGSERAYMGHEGWGRFLTIIGDADDDDPSGDTDYMKCDVNGDGEVNIADVNTVIDAILNH